MFCICYYYQWDAVENKSTVFLYGGGALVAVWLSSILVGAINSVPLVSPLNGKLAYASVSYTLQDVINHSEF